jgi:hypothetical protein
MNTFAFRSRFDAEHAYFVLLHTKAAPDATTWTRYVDALAEQIARSTRTIHIFAVTDGGGPDPGQRRALAEAFAADRRGAMTHVFTTSAFTRGIVTAFHWVARSRAVAHNPDVFALVCEQCQVPVRAVLDDLFAVQKALPAVALLAQLEHSSRSSRSQGVPPSE